MREWKTTAGAGLAGVVAALAALGGCTAESLRIALQAQQRADEVQQAVFEQQHEALRVLLYRDLRQRLTPNGVSLTAEQQSVLNDAWNERDVLEFWAVQQERARALRLVGVDTRLYSDQSAVDLLCKALAAKADRFKSGIAARAGRHMAEQFIEDNGSE